ncbi:glutaminase A [Leptolyngbya sp. FACHB-261]|uniref:glutaminase A n=1 Tax=Leptolyngbya sp. FACHB-261 TaxID=2692806 RepID=UPI001687DD52|nr:glutaminase A [Leptolyngbya sp. FACHB-261]MBD2105105.1 glutaminase A [Leptolyngbya sp. FACHB-261]
MVGPNGLAALTQTQLDHWVDQARAYIQPPHQLPNHIPLLAQANPAWLAIQVQTLQGESFKAGKVDPAFALMSVVKPLVLLFLLEYLGADTVFQHVGMDPSDRAFNCLTQLELDLGWPRNPLINSGAIVLASLLPGQDAQSRCAALCHWLCQQSGQQLFLNETLLASVRLAGGHANRALARTLVQHGKLGEPELALNTYNHLCCLSGTVANLAGIGLLLAKPGHSPRVEHRRIVNALMSTCGLYEASGRFAARVGLPTKSGVSGALLSVVPSQGAIACYSPALDLNGNSLAGCYLLEQMAQALNLSLFS